MDAATRAERVDRVRYRGRSFQVGDQLDEDHFILSDMVRKVGDAVWIEKWCVQVDGADGPFIYEHDIDDRWEVVVEVRGEGRTGGGV